MRRPSVICLLAASVLFSFMAFSAAREITVFSAVSAASGTSTPERTAGYSTINVQVCGAGFDGTVTVNQGAKSTTLSEVKALTLSGVTGCAAANYVKLNRAAWTGISYTRSAGTVTVYMELAP